MSPKVSCSPPRRPPGGTITVPAGRSAASPARAGAPAAGPPNRFASPSRVGVRSLATPAATPGRGAAPAAATPGRGATPAAASPGRGAAPASAIPGRTVVSTPGKGAGTPGRLAPTLAPGSKAAPLKAAGPLEDALAGLSIAETGRFRSAHHSAQGPRATQVSALCSTLTGRCAALYDSPLLPAPCSLLPAPYSLLPTPCSLLPAPY